MTTYRDLKNNLLAVCASLLLSTCAFSQTTTLFDDFDDGDALDVTPASWAVGVDNGARAVVDGSYRISANGIASSFPNRIEGFDNENPFVVGDGVITTQLHFVSGAGFAGVFGRSGEIPATYYSSIDHNGLLLLGESTPTGELAVLGQMETGLDPTRFDIRLNLGMSGSTLTASAWLADEPMPTLPLITANDNSFTMGGAGLVINTGIACEVDFRFFQVVPEPTSVVATFFPMLFLLHHLRRRRFDAYLSKAT